MANTYVPSGAVSFQINMNAAVAVGANNLNAYNVPISANPIATESYSVAGGTGAGAIQKSLEFSGTMASNTSSATIISLASAGTNNVDVGGSTAAWAHVRSITIFNDGNSSGFTSADANILTWDFTATNAWGVGGGAAGPITSPAGGTGCKIDIPAGSFLRFAKPWGTAGWTVNVTTAMIIALLTPAGNANTIAYRIVILGD